MCLSIPSKVVEIDENNIATVDTMGVKRKASLDLVEDEINVGDYVILHVGFIMGKMDEEAAKQSLEAYEEIVKTLEAEEAE